MASCADVQEQPHIAMHDSIAAATIRSFSDQRRPRNKRLGVARAAASRVRDTPKPDADHHCGSWHGRLRGARTREVARGCTNRQAVVRSRTSCKVPDVPQLFSRPTEPKPAAFILPTRGRVLRSPPPRRMHDNMRHATNGARIAHHGLLSTGSTLNACELAGSRLVRAQACDQLTAIALHADSVSMERPIHRATPNPCRERRARQPSRRASDANSVLRNPHAGHATDARPPNPERRQSACLRSLSPRSAAIRTAFANVLSGRFREPR
jgi:hypothetical protein